MTMASEELLCMLKERCRLNSEQLEHASAVYSRCLQVLESDGRSSASLLGQAETNDEVWRPCIVWLIKSIPGLITSSAAPDAYSSIPLSEILNACHINLVSFFKELPVVLNKLKPFLSEVAGTDNIEAVLKLREWQETLVSLTHISNKYKDLFWAVQRSSPTAKQPLLRAGWLAFLIIKAQLLPGFPDLVSCLELLVCVLNLFMASTAFSEAQLAALQSSSPAAIEASGKFCTLKALSLEAKVDTSKTKKLMPQIEARFRALLTDSQFSWLPQPLPERLPHPQAAQVDTCCELYLEGLVSKPQQLAELVLSLDEAYQKFYMQQGEIDERDFLLNDFGALASPRAMPGAAAEAAPAAMPGAQAVAAAAAAPSAAAAAAAGVLAGLGHTHGGLSLNPSKPPLAPGGLKRPISLGLQSPLPLMHLGPPGPATPISSAMGSVAWLRGIARDLPLEPRPSLVRYMDAAGADAGRVLVERVQAAAAAVFMPDAPAGGGGAIPGQRTFPEVQQGVAQDRRDEGIKVYWHVLEAMLRAEEGRAGLPAAVELLVRWSFHQCILACSFELVAASYRMGLLSFPAIPAKLGLKPFDLSKMIGPFVKAEPTLPRELKRHMFTVEEKILESLGWAPGSSFYRLTRAATGQQQQQQQEAAAAAVGAAAGEGGSEDGEQEQQKEKEDAVMADRAAAAAAADKQEQEEQDGEQQQEQDMAAGRQEQQQESEEQQPEQKQEQQQEGAAAAAAAGGSRKRAGMHSSSSANTEPMDTDAATAAASGAQGDTGDNGSISIVPKRQRGEHGGVNSHPHSHASFAAPEQEAPLPRALGLPGAVVPGGDPSARAVLHDYCRKVLKLAAFRLVAVSDGLDFSPMDREEVVAAVHEVISHALYHHTYLFYSRHLDTLLLASLYGYCKVNRLNQITFREIISHYKRQAHAKQEVFRTVVLEQTDPGLVIQTTGDIIAFYNAVFVPAMKGFLLTTVQQQQGTAAAAGSNGRAPQGSSIGRQGSGELAAGASESAGAKSPIFTALMHAAQQQQRSQAAVVGSGSAYRALSLAGGGGGGLAGLGGGLAGLGSGLAGAGVNPGMDPGFSTSLSLHGPGGLGVGVLPDDGGMGEGFGAGWGTDDAGAGMAAAAAVAAAAGAGAFPLGRPAAGKAAVMTGGSNAPQAASRLSRLSRPCSGSAGAAGLQQLGQLNPKVREVTPQHAAAGDQQQRQQQQQGLAAVGSYEGTLAVGNAAAGMDALPQQDQDIHVAAAAVGNGSSDAAVQQQQQDQAARSQEPAAAAENMDCDGPPAAAANGCIGSGSRPAAAAASGSPGSGSASGAEEMSNHPTKQRLQLQGESTPQPSSSAGGGSASPAGLATLMQALDTSSNRGGSVEGREADAAAAGLQQFGQQQQQQAVMQDS